MDIKNNWVRRILAGIGLVILLFLILDFNSRMAELTRLTSQFKSETAEMEGYDIEKEILDSKIAYANSDDAIEKWAREQGRYMKPGDHPIIPLSDPNFVEGNEPQEKTEFESKSVWDLWDFWLFGETP